MKKKDCISMHLKEMKFNLMFRDIDKRDKEEIKKLGEEYKSKLLQMDTEHLEGLKCSILNRRYELDNHVVSLTPDLWTIDILIDDEYNRYMSDKTIRELMDEGTSKRKVRKR